MDRRLLPLLVVAISILALPTAGATPEHPRDFEAAEMVAGNEGWARTDRPRRGRPLHDGRQRQPLEARRELRARDPWDQSALLPRRRRWRRLRLPRARPHPAFRRRRAGTPRRHRACRPKPTPRSPSRAPKTASPSRARKSAKSSSTAPWSTSSTSAPTEARAGPRRRNRVTDASRNADRGLRSAKANGLSTRRQCSLRDSGRRRKSAHPVLAPWADYLTPRPCSTAYGLQVYVCRLEDLANDSPFALIFRGLTDPDRPIDWLGDSPDDDEREAPT